MIQIQEPFSPLVGRVRVFSLGATGGGAWVLSRPVAEPLPRAVETPRGLEVFFPRWWRQTFEDSLLSSLTGRRSERAPG